MIRLYHQVHNIAKSIKWPGIWSLSKIDQNYVIQYRIDFDQQKCNMSVCIVMQILQNENPPIEGAENTSTQS